MRPTIDRLRLLEALYKRDEGRDANFLVRIDRLVQHDIRRRALECRFCRKDLSGRDDSLVGFARDELYDDGRRRTEFYNFCSESCMRNWESWETD